MVGACPVAATSTDCNSSFVTKSRKIFTTEKASRLPEKDNTFFALFAATGMPHISISALLWTTGQ